MPSAVCYQSTIVCVTVWTTVTDSMRYRQHARQTGLWYLVLLVCSSCSNDELSNDYKNNHNSLSFASKGRRFIMAGMADHNFDHVTDHRSRLPWLMLSQG